MCSDMCVSSEQIEQWKQENPDDVDEVPVEAADLNRAVVLGVDRAAPGPDEHPRHDAEADDHVQRVQPGHREVEREEDLRVPGELLLLELEAGPRHMMLGELLVV